ncbi:MAG: methionyl-tRNA formyltransferase [Gemmatimonadetes bacterium]|nr:methionyl-tRNA formyltransferase [Gemmatimonadota bacterium]
MRVVFWGSPAFGLATLEALLDSRHHVVGVVTRPPRPKGRGRKARPTPVAEAAEAAEIPILAPRAPRGLEFLAALETLRPDVSVVAAYGAILPAEVLELPPYGSINVHASMLPAYRGAAPVTRAILDGLEETGVTIMRMEAGLDTGPVLLQEVEPIRPGDTAGSLTERLAARGASLVVEALDGLESGDLQALPQDESRASYAAKVAAEEAEIDWRRTGREIDRAVRAYDPWPGAWTTWRGERLKVYRVEVVERDTRAAPGTVAALAPRPVVATGDGAVALVELHPSGGRRMDAADWARGRDVAPGERLGGR